MSDVTTTVTGMAAAIVAGELTSVQATQTALARIAALDASLGSHLHVDAQGALRAAAAIDVQRSAGQPLGPLAGVPISLKDNIAATAMPMTAGSRILQGYVPPFDATVTARLRAAGAILIGKTSMDEFAMGSSSESSAFGSVRNPWDLGRVPGGSSGGSAAAVAAGLVPGALGTDTGGSIRQPAALCGIVGLKPSYGRVSRYGAVAYASSLDQIGPLTRTVADAARLLSVIGGWDPRDSTSVNVAQPDYEAALSGEVRGLRLGVPREYLDDADGLDPAVHAAVTGALEVLRDQGAEIVACSLPHTRLCIAAYYLIATAEASANLARYDGVRFGHRAALHSGDGIDDLYARSRGEGFGAEVKRRIVLGTFALSAGYHDAYYRKACQVRRLIHDELHAALQTCDALVGPTSPVVAWPIGEKTANPLEMYLMDIFTLGANLAGLPGLSVPLPLHPSGLPVGLQLLGRPFDEATLLRIGDAYTRISRTDQQRPDLGGAR